MLFFSTYLYLPFSDPWGRLSVQPNCLGNIGKEHPQINIPENETKQNTASVILSDTAASKIVPEGNPSQLSFPELLSHFISKGILIHLFRLRGLFTLIQSFQESRSKHFLLGILSENFHFPTLGCSERYQKSYQSLRLWSLPDFAAPWQARGPLMNTRSLKANKDSSVTEIRQDLQTSKICSEAHRASRVR